MSRPIEAAAGLQAGEAPWPAPYVHRRTVRFGDSDAARIVYTIRLFDYAIEAIEGWFDEVLGHRWYELNTRHGVGNPFVHAELDMQAPLTPGDAVAVTVLVADTGRSTIRFRVLGHRGDGVLAFAGTWVSAFVDAEAMRSMPIPDSLARRIDAYRRRCPPME